LYVPKGGAGSSHRFLRSKPGVFFMSTILPVKGTRDFFPEDMAFRQWLYANIREVSEAFGYQEFEAPLIERVELYAAKSGEELVNEQSFVFEDKSGEMITLRPELTPSLARMIAARSRALPKPIRWWSFGPFWRYERPQRGRTREFFQWNIDLLGVDSPQADAELLAVVALFFKNIGLTPNQVGILVNNRRLADKQLQSIDAPSNKKVEIFRLIDRKEKMSDQAWKAYASDLGLSSDQFNRLTQILTDKDAWSQSEELVQCFKAVEALGISDYVSYDPTIIRGLDYYTGTVFEACDLSGDKRSILGGGRYDDLVSDVGGDPLPGVGFAMGDVVIQLILEELGLVPDLRVNPADVLVPTFDENLLEATLSLASELRFAGFKVEWFPQADRLQKQFRYADRQGIPLVAIIGPDEIADGKVTIKDLRSGKQESIDRDMMAQYLNECISVEKNN
jgi:histidyl-tRNA synthetase